MRNQMNIREIAILSCMSLALACSPAAEEACGSGDSASPSCLQNRRQEGRSWQGRSWQGRSWQGRSWQGTDAAVSTIQEVRLAGTPVENLQLSGTVLTGTVSGQSVAGADFAGATVLQHDPDGLTTETTITAVQSDPQDAEILLYTLTAYDTTTGSQQNLCDPDPWGGQYATVVRGSWTFSGDHVNVATDLMFACTSGVVAKCARWGYKPWKTVNGRQLSDYHQACTRMARADYCGDGVTHTDDGTLIDLYDDLGIQVRSGISLTSPLIFDAAWTTAGAYCMTKDRWLKLSSLASVTLDCKSRFVNLFPLLETSPVDARDLCAVKRSDLSRSAVHIDNQSGLNVSLY